MNYKSIAHRSIWWFYTLLLIATSVLYFGNLIDHGLDAHDEQTFLDNLAISADFWHFFSLQKSQSSGRPTAEFFKFAAYLIGGNNPAFFHLLPIGLHILSSLLLARLVYYLRRDLSLSLLTGLLFLIGVSHFQAIHHISALDYPLSFALALAAALTYLRFVDDARPRYLIYSLALISLSVGAHISSAVLIVFCFAFHRRQPLAASLRWILAISLCALPFAALALTARTTTTWAALDAHMDQGLLTLIPDIASMYLWLLSRLFTTAYWHPVAAASAQPWEFYAGAIALLSLLWLAWEKRALTAAVAWILLGLLPFALLTWDVLFLLPSGASRYLYLASAGTAFGSAWALRETARILATRAIYWQVAPYGAVLLLAISSYFTLLQTENLSLYSSARSYVARGDSATGIAVLKQLFASPHLSAVPTDEAYFLLCSAMPFQDEDPTPYLQAGLAQFPDHLGLQTIAAALAEHNPDAAIRQRGEQQMQALYEQAAATQQDQHFLRNLAAIYHNIGLGHLSRDDFQAAEAALLQTLQIHPDRAITRRILSRTYLHWAESMTALGQDAAARAILQHAVAFDPQHLVARLDLADHFYRIGAWTEASAQYRSILASEQHSRAWFNLGLDELNAGQIEQGRRTFLQALAVFGFAEAHRVGAVAELKKMIRSENDNPVTVHLLEELHQYQ